MYYSDENFALRVNEKVGNVRFFKKCLREKGLIGIHQQLSDEFIDTFKEIVNIRIQQKSTWEQAVNEIFKKEHSENNMYNIQIIETWITNQKNRYTFTLYTHIPFIPQIGMQWNSFNKDIDIKVENLMYNEDMSVFVIKNTFRDINSEEIEARRKLREEIGWNISELN
ncbi:hypothetical protein [Bacillus pseudomycoides]|uniref:hypothetical protein n=1 Tax=Bacillus pseudomycoides TaxID=64104 RepID=UPI0023DCC5AF|nr:hypothetical protein [Bacillus pseudomycoides]MDF2084637.1 hypothetical protein [Bacillus pseudomycoides]